MNYCACCQYRHVTEIFAWRTLYDLSNIIIHFFQFQEVKNKDDEHMKDSSMIKKTKVDENDKTRNVRIEKMYNIYFKFF